MYRIVAICDVDSAVLDKISAKSLKMVGDVVLLSLPKIEAQTK